MKKSDIEKQLKKFGWYLEREGGSHEVWTNGEMKTAVPRHREIKEFTARGILKTAQENPGDGKC